MRKTVFDATQGLTFEDWAIQLGHQTRKPMFQTIQPRTLLTCPLFRLFLSFWDGGDVPSCRSGKACASLQPSFRRPKVLALCLSGSQQSHRPDHLDRDAARFPNPAGAIGAELRTAGFARLSAEAVRVANSGLFPTFVVRFGASFRSNKVPTSALRPTFRMVGSTVYATQTLLFWL